MADYTRIVFLTDSTGRLCGFDAVGHAGDMPEGENIVCAAISAILQTAYLGFTQVLGQKVDWQADEQTAHMRCIVSGDKPEMVDCILKTAQAGLADIAGQYPKCLTIAHEVIQP